VQSLAKPGVRIASAAVWLLLAASAAAAPDLKRIMADPDWIGPPVEAAWWQLDGNGYYYRVKRAGSDVRDVRRVDLRDGADARLDAGARAAIDAAEPVFDRERSRALMIRDGSLYLRDLDEGRLLRLHSGPEPVDAAQFSADGRRVQFRAGDHWFRVGPDGRGAVPVADLRFDEDPHAEPDEAGLEADQLRLFETLARERKRALEQHDRAVADAAADPGRRPPPWYLGADHEAATTALSPDGRWMLVVVRPAGHDDGESDRMPRFVTESGYVEIEDVRTLVGRRAPASESLWLLDLDERTRHEIDLAGLEGRAEDPLAGLKAEQDIEPHDAENPRPVTIGNLRWHPDGRRVLFLARAVDNKDRWSVVLDAETRETRTVHRLTDPAWINWAFNEAGWVPDSDRVWLLSEESGYSHLYTFDARGRARQHTRGDFEVYDIRFSKDGTRAWMLSNRAHPTEYDLYRLALGNDEWTRLTELKGVESYALHPSGEAVLIRYSQSYLPTQAAVVQASGELIAATDTRTDAYRAIEWQPPEFVGIASSHVDRPVWTKFYPARGESDGRRPVVVFVHGAGYTQNTHHRFPYYFREQMFHNLLTARGYHVIDMDYRASRGYGRDWRTAIYRQMGTPELEDLIDGVNWLVDNHNGDPDRVGVYGGSYGGFMTFMAMFKAPEVFDAGASLRPVTDWRHYNHFYTSNILNTPAVDPEAHRRSSPIEFAEGLGGRLLITHGMLDDNVFYKDSVRLAQRLIELEKPGWEFASYPLEPHSFVHPESWLDQYRRILDLFETAIGD